MTWDLDRPPASDYVRERYVTALSEPQPLRRHDVAEALGDLFYWAAYTLLLSILTIGPVLLVILLLLEA